MHRLLIIAGICLLLFSGSTFSQTRTRRSSPATSTRSSSSEQATAIHNEAAAKVGIQIKNLSAFLYLLGGVAKSMQELDAAAKSGNASPAALQQNEQNKARIKASFEDFRVGLDNLEIYFRSTAGRQNYFFKVASPAH